MKLTEEQSSLLAMAIANPDVLIITASGSPNDDVWRALADRGALETVTEFTDPALAEIVNCADLRAYRIRQPAPSRVVEFNEASATTGSA